MTPAPGCSVCKKPDNGEVKIQRCSRCHSRFYCGRECQTADWPTHKAACGKTMQWYDRFRKCKDGSRHEGRLELITWPNAKEGTGWGQCFADEADDLRRKFEEEYDGDEGKFFKYWPQGFRWTCCGTDSGMKWGCDHHGSGSKPCTCDFCRMGKPLPDSVFNDDSATRHGLNLRRGPDPRSFNAGLATVAAASRTMMGLEM
ncbi:hypothetical protein GALMADRAFT_255247 [Galerina marginata CBS 339.88]|uniref:MYND-type domain-containing protein n=1 Tax=Galerina marginata (strain CBS 339.88) TaxID=685588 RepID=A0A067SGA4_GALM3|nr:hypothetical protein GALMADRAFT_255247 [Galerina marginata CBS 339.88]